MRESIEIDVSRRSPPRREVRCDCGALLARMIDGQIVLKCRRCKRVVGIAEITTLTPCCEGG